MSGWATTPEYQQQTAILRELEQIRKLLTEMNFVLGESFEMAKAGLEEARQRLADIDGAFQ